MADFPPNKINRQRRRNNFRYYHTREYTLRQKLHNVYMQLNKIQHDCKC